MANRSLHEPAKLPSLAEPDRLGKVEASNYRYRRPLIGQAFVDLIEGRHPRNLTLDGFGGKYLVICCFGSSQIEPGRVALDAVREHAALFDGAKMCLLAVTIDPHERIEKPACDGIYFHLDQDGAISRHCAAAPLDPVPLGTQYRVTWTIVDPSLHVVEHFHTGADRAGCQEIFALLTRLPEADGFRLHEIPAPVLVLPRVFEPELCDQLIALYEDGRPRDSGFMRNNVEVFDYSFKRRRDYFIADETVQKAILRRVSLCVIPEIRKLFFMNITRMERYLVGCYAADEQAHFRPHRDNGQAVTAHRRFALSIALNDDFEGGDLMFPEYNLRPHKVPKGWCIVFPCAILHTVTRVTRGCRYVFLPFLYDEPGARIKLANEDKAQKARTSKASPE